MKRVETFSPKTGVKQLFCNAIPQGRVVSLNGSIGIVGGLLKFRSGFSNVLVSSADCIAMDRSTGLSGRVEGPARRGNLPR
jgi:hypothetical protein